MTDALISPAVGAAMWTATAATAAYAARRVSLDPDQSKIPLMGVLGAFIFAAQMLNFSIPGTGSSGHLGGGLMLAILLGPWRAFLVMASVLSVQALFFADGGLLSLGANVFNMGLLSAFIAYPLYRVIAGKKASRGRMSAGAMVAAIVTLQLGALGVVLQTTLSGVSSLPFAPFAALMLPIHLPIGIVEGLVTAAVITFVLRSRPELLQQARPEGPTGGGSPRKIVVGFAVAAALCAGVLSLYSSSDPDGLEWSIDRVTSGAGLNLPAVDISDSSASTQKPDPGSALPALAGGIIVLIIAFAIGLILRRTRFRASSP